MQNDFRSELYISTCPRCPPHVWKDHRHRFAKMFQVQPALGHPDGKEQNICHTGIPLF